MVTNKIYRVFDNKKRYRQSYSAKIKDCYQWALDCATSERGYVYEDTLNESGETIDSKMLYFAGKK